MKIHKGTLGRVNFLIEAGTGTFKKLWILLLGFLILGVSELSAQEVNATIDTTAIRIGEQIQYRISVKTDTTDLVIFPEGQTFVPFEVVESFAPDSTYREQRLELVKTYALTHWDSGSYTIPRQRVNINDKQYFTDSLLVEVGTVAVDTTKQKMFPIKPSVDVPNGSMLPGWTIWLLVILLLIAFAIFWFLRRRRKKAEAEKKLPPYEQAIFELHQLDASHLLEQRELKEYYSLLSAALRRYLDQEVFDHAMESTTEELILYLERERAEGHLNVPQETLDTLKRILQRADLAKFANSRPDVLTAKEDRNNVENVINRTKESIPEPSEEELLRDQKYREYQARKKKVKKIVIGLLVLVVVIGGLTGYVISTKGLDHFRDTYLGSKSKELLEEDWIRSEYGTPPVAVTTPEVLVRVLQDTLAKSAGKETFRAGSIEGPLYVDVNTRPAGTDFKLDKAVDEVYAYLEAKGAKNIITKQEEISTVNGAEGLRIFGTMTLEPGDQVSARKEYSILNFGQSGGYQQVVVIYNEEDEYGKEIAQRITQSVELRNMEN